MAPATSQVNQIVVGPVRVIEVVYVYILEVADLPWEEQDLAHVDQAAQFDRTT
jgi:hypothetical protein